jgi:membrane protein DedA with SNARE-associated domain
MIEQGVHYVQALISTYGVWGVIVAAIIEEVVAPIPSSLVPLAAGFFLLPANAVLPLVVTEAALLIALPVGIVITLASIVIYTIAYWGGKPVIDRFHRVLGVTWTDVERIERRVVRGNRDEITLVVLRLLPLIPGVALSGFCGVVRYSFPRFVVTTLLGSSLRAWALALIGWQAGEFYFKYVEIIGKFEKQIFFGVILTAVLLGVLYVIWRRMR